MVTIIDLNALPRGICLVEGLVDTATVEEEKSSILHEFDATLFKGRATLRAIVQDGQLDSGGRVSDRQCRIDRIVV